MKSGDPVLTPLPDGCLVGRFLRRVKRFSVEFELAGQRQWAHTNNSGAMLGLLQPGAPVLVSPAQNSRRKLPFTLERVWIRRPDSHGVQAGFWVGVDTGMPNRFLEAAFHAKKLPFATGYTQIAREVTRGQSRLDARFTAHGLPPLWVECKNATLVEDEIAGFPDAPSQRAKKHLLELADIARQGERAAMFYLVQRPDGKCFGPADYIDEEYAELFYDVLDRGVEVYACRAILDPDGVRAGEFLNLARTAKAFFE